MKKLLLPFLIAMMMTNTYATIEDDGQNPVPSQVEISKNRACFEDLTDNGCGDPGEDPAQFRACLHNVFPRLTTDCQKLMSELYSRKK